MILIYSIPPLFLITIIDTIGAIASRKLKFKYEYLTPLSLLTYIITGFLLGTAVDILTLSIISGLVGLYDGTLGFWFSIKLNAYSNISIEQRKKLLGVRMALIMVIVAFLFALAGYSLRY